MPLGVKPVCSLCKTTDSPIWDKDANGEVLCNACMFKQCTDDIAEVPSDTNGKGKSTLSPVLQKLLLGVRLLVRKQTNRVTRGYPKVIAL